MYNTTHKNLLFSTLIGVGMVKDFISMQNICYTFYLFIKSVSNSGIIARYMYDD